MSYVIRDQHGRAWGCPGAARQEIDATVWLWTSDGPLGVGGSCVRDHDDWPAEWNTDAIAVNTYDSERSP